MECDHIHGVLTPKGKALRLPTGVGSWLGAPFEEFYAKTRDYPNADGTIRKTPVFLRCLGEEFNGVEIGTLELHWGISPDVIWRISNGRGGHGDRLIWSSAMFDDWAVQGIQAPFYPERSSDRPRWFNARSCYFLDAGAATRHRWRRASLQTSASDFEYDSFGVERHYDSTRWIREYLPELAEMRLRVHLEQYADLLTANLPEEDYEVASPGFQAYIRPGRKTSLAKLELEMVTIATLLRRKDKLGLVKGPREPLVKELLAKYPHYV